MSQKGIGDYYTEELQTGMFSSIRLIKITEFRSMWNDMTFKVCIHVIVFEETVFLRKKYYSFSICCEQIETISKTTYRESEKRVRIHYSRAKAAGCRKMSWLEQPLRAHIWSHKPEAELMVPVFEISKSAPSDKHPPVLNSTILNLPRTATTWGPCIQIPKTYEGVSSSVYHPGAWGK